jgi:hypothetical protein
VFDHGARIRLQTRHGATNVGVDFDDLLDGGGDEKWRCDALFDAEEDAMGCCDLFAKSLKSAM